MSLDLEEKLVREFFLSKRNRILDAQVSLGLKASGLSARLLTTRESGNVFQLVDEAGYFEQQEFGLAPGNAPSVQAIYDWLAFKKYGFDWKDDEERISMAFAIQESIEKRGTYTYRTKPTRVLQDTLNEDDINDLTARLSNERVNQILTDVQRIFN